MYALGVDSGTRGTRVLIVEFDSGRVLGRGSSAHDAVSGLGPGESEQEPATWIRAFERALRKALHGAKIDPGKIVALGVAGQQHGFVPLDSDGHPIRPAKLWNDVSTLSETEAIVRRLGGRKRFVEKLGVGLSVGYTASKILWLKNHEPGHFRQLATVLLPHNYLNLHLTGIRQMEFGDASGTGLMDIRRREWQKEALAAVDPSLKNRLPPLRHPREPVGYVRRALASQFGMKRVLVASGGGDNMMAAIGTGNVVPGRSTLSLGTSGTISSYSENPVIDPEGRIAAFCDSTGGWLPLLCTMNVANATDAAKAVIGIGNRELESLASQAPPGSDGLVFLPFLDGERIPELPYASGGFSGLSSRNFDAPHIARAVMEGTILNLGYGFSLMKNLGLNPSELRATGGAAKNRLWLQIVADVLKTTVVIPREKEAAAFGAAVQSIWNYWGEKGRPAKIADLTASMVREKEQMIEPEAKNFDVYDAAQKTFNSLWKKL
jgi:xylulokinase